MMEDRYLDAYIAMFEDLIACGATLSASTAAELIDRLGGKSKHIKAGTDHGTGIVYISLLILRLVRSESAGG